MIKVRNGLITALDIGSSKVCCLVAKITEKDKLKVIGVSQHASQGIKSGTIIDMEYVEKAISQTITAAEQVSHERIQDVVVNVSAGYPSSKMIESDIILGGKEIDDYDLSRVLEYGRSVPDSADRTLIHSIPVSYSIDGSYGIRDPRGMFGGKLSANIHMVTSSVSAMRNLANCIARCHLDIASAVVSPYASGLSCLLKDEKDLGVTLIDMGAGTTTIAVFFEDTLVYTDSIPVGGQHVTYDIARGLGTPFVQAERLKNLYGHALASTLDNSEMIDVPQVGNDQYTQIGPISRSVLVGIIQPRLEEIFELIKGRLEASGFDKITGRHVVLTGGASQLPGMRDLAALLLNKQVRMGRPSRLSGLQDPYTGPGFSTAIGMLIYTMKYRSEYHSDMNAEAQKQNLGVLSRMKTWFKQQF
jgi:cell division protein FtsA